MTPVLRKLNLTAHVASSVGWAGAVTGFLALSVAGLTSRDPETVRSVYLAMNLMGQWVIVPLSLAALVTGLVQSAGTHWGFFRYHWVVVKLVLTVAAVVGLLLHQFTAVQGAARRAGATAPGTPPEVGGLGIQLVADSGLGLLILLVATTLGIYKPWGMTRYGRRTSQTHQDAERQDGFPRSLKIALMVVGVLVAVVAMVHLAGGGLGHHGH